MVLGWYSAKRRQIGTAHIISFKLGVEIGQMLALTGVMMTAGFMLVGYQLAGYFFSVCRDDA